MRDKMTKLEHTANTGNSKSDRVLGGQVKFDRGCVQFDRAIQMQYQANPEG
jgi:hypothetical protein